MSATTFNTRHTVTGALQRLTEDQIKPFADVLEIVPDDAKPFAPGFFKPGKVGEFKNPEPPTDAIAEAQAEYDAILETKAPNSRAAREAKEKLDTAIAESEAAKLEAQIALETAQDGEQSASETPEGENQ